MGPLDSHDWSLCWVKHSLGESAKVSLKVKNYWNNSPNFWMIKRPWLREEENPVYHLTPGPTTKSNATHHLLTCFERVNPDSLSMKTDFHPDFKISTHSTLSLSPPLRGSSHFVSVDKQTMLSKSPKDRVVAFLWLINEGDPNLHPLGMILQAASGPPNIWLMRQK